MTTLPSAMSTSTKQDEQPVESEPFIVSNPTSVSQPILSKSSALSSESGSNTSSQYGIDWSDRAHPTSHCWFPFTSNDPLTSQSCGYIPCENPKSTRQSALLQCGSCDLVIHSYHLNDSQTASVPFHPPCRPSFVDNTSAENSSNDSNDYPLKYDRHFWIRVSILPKSCMHCQGASLATTLFGGVSDRLSTVPGFGIFDQAASFINSIPGNSESKMFDLSGGLVCLWCSQGFHESCLKSLSHQDDKLKCDYGIFRNIIVRPQWLSRSRESPTGFRAQLPSHLANENSESNYFPYTPVLLFINKRSGGQIGEKIYRELLRKLNPRQVFLLENNATIVNALDMYSSLPNTRICVFGGDGTVGWVLGCLVEIYPSTNSPPVSICPLGTGNDLSRVLAWGEQYDPQRPLDTLVQTHQAQVVPLDRWHVQLEQIDTPSLTLSGQEHYKKRFQIGRIFDPSLNHPKFVYETNRVFYHKYHELPNKHFINYMSFGLDAAITLDFHDERTRDPSKFSSPWKNKLMYLNESCKYINDFALAKMWNLGTYIRLICDGQDLTNNIRDCHTLIVLNIPGYAAGTDPWGKSIDQTIVSTNCFEQQNIGDRKIEVVGLNTTHMASIHMGFQGTRMAQCNQLRIELYYPMTAQMDGEPFYLPSSVALNINHAGQVLLLKNENT